MAATLEDVRGAFNGLLGAGRDDVQAAYGCEGDWCAMTIYVGFRNAGALDILNGGTPTAWVPDLWAYYNARGLTGQDPRPGALTIFDYNGNGTPDHVEFCDSVESDGTFNDISGNSGRDYVFAENVGMYGVMGFCYPEYKAETETAATEETTITGEKMQFIYRPNGENYLNFYDGSKSHRLVHPDEVEAINMAFNKCYGRDIPMFELGDAGSPFATRFIEGTER